jgi:tetratricopeptide (TPR) repeat protein
MRLAAEQKDSGTLLELARAPEMIQQPPYTLQRLGVLLCTSAGQRDAGRGVLRQSQQLHPSDFWINTTLGRELCVKAPDGHRVRVLESRDIDAPERQEAVRFLSIAVALQPDSSGALVNLGVAFRGAGRLDEAIAVYRKAIGLKPGVAGFHSELANAYLRQGKINEAIAEYRKAIDLEPKASSLRYNLASAFQRQGNWDQAIAAARQAIELEVDYDWAHLLLAQCLYNKGQFDASIVESRTAMRVGKRCLPEAHCVLGIALFQKGELDQGVAEFRAGIDLAPNVADHHYNFGCCLQGQGKVDEAMAEYRTALGLNPDHAEVYWMRPHRAEAHCNLGNCLETQGKQDEAIAEYRAALRTKQIFPEAFRARYNIAGCLQKQGKLDEAIAEYRAAIGVKPEFPEAHCNLGCALLAKGDLAQALDFLKRGHELGSRNPSWPYPSAGWVQHGERVVRLGARLPRILAGEQVAADGRERMAVGFLYSCRRQYELATRCYEQALAQEPGLAEDLKSGARYEAACNAVLAGIGEGQDAAGLGKEQRARRRRQAFDWLRADLRQHARTLQNAAPAARAATARKLCVWLQDSDLRGVREPAYLAKLPVEEREACEKLWAEVRDVLRKAQRKK